MNHELLAQAIVNGGAFVEDEFGLSINQSRLSIYDNEAWQGFLQKNAMAGIRFDLNPYGIYVPADMRAHIDGEHPTIIPNAYHEFLGHGIFCEHSTYGQQIITIASEGKSIEEHLSMPSNQGVAPNHRGNYEGFATWFESVIASEAGYAASWEEKRQWLERAGLGWYLELHELFQAAERRLGRDGLMAKMGF